MANSEKITIQSGKAANLDSQNLAKLVLEPTLFAAFDVMVSHIRWIADYEVTLLALVVRKCGFCKIFEPQIKGAGPSIPQPFRRPAVMWINLKTSGRCNSRP